MERFADITLVGETYAADSIGQMVPTPSKTTVQATITSISAAEFFRAGAEGLKPELVFYVWDFEYNGEQIVEFGGNTYSVYRTHLNDDGKMELYTERKAGTANGEQED